MPVYAQLDANQPIDNYWIRVIPEQVGANGTAATPPGLAVLHYLGAPPFDPKANASQVPISVNPLLEQNLHALGATGVVCHIQLGSFRRWCGR